MGKCKCQTSTTALAEPKGKRCGCKGGKNSNTPLAATSSMQHAANVLANLEQGGSINMEYSDHHHKIEGIKELSQGTFVLQIEKKGLEFRSGQYLSLMIPGDIQARHYSIYSGQNDETLDFLIKEVDGGAVSVALHQRHPNDRVIVEGPWGHFGIKPSDIKERKILFIATGTGIAPFHSMVQTHPELSYTLLHGVRYGEERYEKDDYAPGRYVACTTRDSEGDYHGRVTDYLKSHPVDQGTLCYLCGNSQMIEEAHAILLAQGINNKDILAEIFF